MTEQSPVVLVITFKCPDCGNPGYLNGLPKDKEQLHCNDCGAKLKFHKGVEKFRKGVGTVGSIEFLKHQI